MTEISFKHIYMTCARFLTPLQGADYVISVTDAITDLIRTRKLGRQVFWSNLAPVTTLTLYLLFETLVAQRADQNCVSSCVGKQPTFAGPCRRSQNSLTQSNMGVDAVSADKNFSCRACNGPRGVWAKTSCAGLNLKDS